MTVPSTDEFGSSPSLSALSNFITSSTSHPNILTHAPHYHHLAAQVLHNLQHQHDWTDLRIHTHRPLSSPSDHQGQAKPLLLPRPLICGRPPHRIYVHPDEQIAMLKVGLKEEDVEIEREWVLPTHLKEKWSLRRFAEVFNALGGNHSEADGGGVNHDEDGLRENRKRVYYDGGNEQEGRDADGQSQVTEKGWHRGKEAKRVLLATVTDDSAIVYYIVHDGIVKPRQN